MKKIISTIVIIGALLLIQPLCAQIWEPTKRLTWTSVSSIEPDIVVDSSNTMHVAWADTPNITTEIFYKKSTNGGMTWSGANRLTSTSERSYTPTITIDSNSHIHIVWEEWEKRALYYKRSTNAGNSWTQKRLTWNSGMSRRPMIAFDSNNHIHVIWDDSTPSNWEIFYRLSS